MRSRKSMYNLLAAMMLQLVNLAISIILPRVMIMAFSSEVNGLVSSIRQFINYLTLVEAGLAGACIYSLYKPLANKNYSEVNGILSGAKNFYNRSGMIFSGLALILALAFPYIVNIESINNFSITILVLILGINGALEFFSMGKYRVLLTADQRSYIISIIQIMGQILNCTIIVIMIINKYNIVIVQLAATTSYIIRSILFNIYVKRVYKFVDFNVKPSKTALHQRWDVLFHQIGGMVVFNSPIALITLFCTLIEVSIYTIYNMVFSGINGIIGIFNNGLMAGIGDIISKEDTVNLQRVYREYECGYYMIVTWMYTCTFILIIPFITIYTTGIDDANYISNELATLFVIIGILNALRVPQATVVGAAGHFKQTKYRALTEVIINIVSSITLVSYFGMTGVLLGSICSYSYRTIDLIKYTPKYITKLPVQETIQRIIRMAIIGVIVIAPFKTFINIKVDNIIEWIIWGGITALWSGIVVFIGNYIIEKKTIKSLINRLIIIKNIRQST
jgi:O-antigen/teichoic acid export membrane protein